MKLILTLLLAYVVHLYHVERDQRTTDNQRSQQLIQQLCLQVLKLETKIAKSDAALGERLMVVHTNIEKRKQLEQIVWSMGVDPATGELVGMDFPNPLLPPMNVNGE